jgi:hypothetical protein
VGKGRNACQCPVGIVWFLGERERGGFETTFCVFATRDLDELFDVFDFRGHDGRWIGGRPVLRGVGQDGKGGMVSEKERQMRER